MVGCPVCGRPFDDHLVAELIACQETREQREKRERRAMKRTRKAVRVVEPRVPWELTDEDRVFLKVNRIVAD